MSSFAPNTYMPQPVPGHRIGIHNQANSSSLARYGGAPPHNNNKLPLFPSWPESSFPQRTAPMTAQNIIVPHEVLEQRARTPCKHFEHHGGWCPYGSECHFLHDYSRLNSRGSSSGSNPPSVASSTCSSLRSSPVPSLPYQAPFVPHAPALTYAPSRFSHAPRHQFTPRTIGGTTYFPIRLGDAHLGYVTPSGVEVFMGH